MVRRGRPDSPAWACAQCTELAGLDGKMLLLPAIARCPLRSGCGHFSFALRYQSLSGWKPSHQNRTRMSWPECRIGTCGWLICSCKIQVFTFVLLGARLPGAVVPREAGKSSRVASVPKAYAEDESEKDCFQYRYPAQTIQTSEPLQSKRHCDTDTAWTPTGMSTPSCKNPWHQEGVTVLM